MNKPYQLRLDEETINKVRELAKENLRSANSMFRVLINEALKNQVGANCGIYRITNPIGEFYIGASKNIKTRFSSHINNSMNINLRNSVLKYGVDNHTFEVIELCEESELKVRENFYIHSLDCDLMMNVAKHDKSNTYSKIVLDVTKDQFDFLLPIARASKRPCKTYQELIELSIEISKASVTYLDKESFENITDLRMP